MSTYKEAGVDLDKADSLVEDYEEFHNRAASELQKNLLNSFGDFATCYDLSDYDSPVMVTSCDGVGTKLKLHVELDRPEYAGIDLVAMNVNDILTTGAQPLLFLDYIAMSPLDESLINRLVDGMTEGCERAHCLLAGGETAELPGLLDEGDVELSGFCTGAAEKDELIQDNPIEAGQKVVGLPSNGFHANGFSLVRKIFREHTEDFDRELKVESITPTRIYADAVSQLETPPTGMVHVTGGGIRGNVERVVPESLGARIQLPEWDHEPARRVLQYVDTDEAKRTFNMGMGWLIILPEHHVTRVLDTLGDASVIGEIVEGSTSIELSN